MTDKNIEKYLAEAIEQNTPDILDSLLNELEFADPQDSLDERLTEGTEENRFTVVKPAREKNGRNGRFLKPLLSIAAALVLVVGGLSVFHSNSAFAVVGMDVNPGIELTINKDEKVTGARAVNGEGEEILSGLDLQGHDIDSACSDLADAMLARGYLSDTSNSILMSVSSKDPGRGREIEQRVTENLNTYLTGSAITPAILAQYVDDDAELRAFAEANGISVGKALLIRKLLNTGSTRMTEGDLLGLTTQELILLGQSRGTESEASYGSADTSSYIGEDAAIAAALAQAGISADAATGINIEFDCDDGMIVYEVEFISGEIEYEYEIDAVSGTVVSEESEAEDSDDVDDTDDDANDADDHDDSDDVADDDDD